MQKVTLKGSGKCDSNLFLSLTSVLAHAFCCAVLLTNLGLERQMKSAQVIFPQVLSLVCHDWTLHDRAWTLYALSVKLQAREFRERYDW